MGGRVDERRGPVEVVRLPEGESGAVVGRLSETVVEKIASYCALPSHVRKSERGKRYATDVAFLAAKLGVTPAFIRKSQRDRRVLGAIRRELDVALTHLMPDLVFVQVQKGLAGDKGSFESVSKILGWLKDSGVTVNNMIQNNTNVSKDGAIQEDLRNYSWMRELRETGVMDQIPSPRDSTDGTGTDS